MKNLILHILPILILVATGLLLSLGLSSGTDFKTVDREFTVIAKQWSWTFMKGEGPDSPKLDSVSIKAGQSVAFKLISEDVFHSFALYSPHGKLVAHAEAIPGVYNKLTYTFAERGEYQILCLEYCGMAHAHMSRIIRVE